MLFKSLISQKLITLITMHRYIPSSALTGVLNVPTICLEWYLTTIVFLPATVLLIHQTEEIVFEKGGWIKGRKEPNRASEGIRELWDRRCDNIAGAVGGWNLKSWFKTMNLCEGYEKYSAMQSKRLRRICLFLCRQALIQHNIMWKSTNQDQNHYRAQLKGGSQVVWLLQAKSGRKVVSKGSIKIHATWGQSFSQALYFFPVKHTQIYRARLEDFPRFGEFCYGFCLPLLPGLACSIHATWGQPFSKALYFFLVKHTQQAHWLANKILPLCLNESWERRFVCSGRFTDHLVRNGLTFLVCTRESSREAEGTFDFASLLLGIEAARVWKCPPSEWYCNSPRLGCTKWTMLGRSEYCYNQYCR